MGSMKEELLDRLEESRDRKLADILGLSYVELQQLDHELEPREDKDGNVVELLVHFGESAPKHILAKVQPALDGSKTAHLDPNVLENYGHEEDNEEEEDDS